MTEFEDHYDLVQDSLSADKEAKHIIQTLGQKLLNKGFSSKSVVSSRNSSRIYNYYSHPYSNSRKQTMELEGLKEEDVKNDNILISENLAHVGPLSRSEIMVSDEDKREFRQENQVQRPETPKKRVEEERRSEEQANLKDNSKNSSAKDSNKIVSIERASPVDENTKVDMNRQQTINRKAAEIKPAGKTADKKAEDEKDHGLYTLKELADQVKLLRKSNADLVNQITRLEVGQKNSAKTMPVGQSDVKQH